MTHLQSALLQFATARREAVVFELPGTFVVFLRPQHDATQAPLILEDRDYTMPLVIDDLHIKATARVAIEAVPVRLAGVTHPDERWWVYAEDAELAREVLYLAWRGLRRDYPWFPRGTSEEWGPVLLLRLMTPAS